MGGSFGQYEYNGRFSCIGLYFDKSKNFLRKQSSSVVWTVDDHTYLFLTQTDHILYFPPSIFIAKPADKSINANYDAVAQAQ